jgi:hypothetical protein
MDEILEKKIEKKKVSFKKPKNISVEVGEETITIRPYLTIPEESSLIQEYIDSLYNKEFPLVYDFLMAEHGLMLHLVDICTDMDIENLITDDLINSSVWNEIKTKSFYIDLRYKIDSIVKRIDEEKSLGNIIQKLADKAEILLNKLLAIDTSKFNMEEITNLFDKLKNEKNNLDNTIFNKDNESISVPPQEIPMVEKKIRKKKSDPKIE